MSKLDVTLSRSSVELSLVSVEFESEETASCPAVCLHGLLIVVPRSLAVPALTLVFVAWVGRMCTATVELTFVAEEEYVAEMPSSVEALSAFWGTPSCACGLCELPCGLIPGTNGC